MQAHVRRIAVVVPVLVCLAVAGCSQSKKSPNSASPAVTTMPSAEAGMSAAAAAASSAPSPAAPASAPAHGAGAPSTAPLLAHRDVVYTADISLRTKAKSVVSVVDDVVAAAQHEGGVMFAQQMQLSNDDANGHDSSAGEATATVTLKVPPDTVNRVLDDIAALGTETSRDVHADDVTSQVVDVTARIDAAKASLQRLNDLKQHAGSISELLNVEDQVAQRTADLESMEQQQQALSSQVAQATITVNVTGTAAPAVTHANRTHLLGFVRGLRGGWHAFTRTVAAVATALGALLPFLAGVGGLVLALLLGRRYLRRWRAHPSARETP